MGSKRLILFLGDGSNSLQLMAEGYARSMKEEDLDFISATMTPPQLSPVAERVMREEGIDISGLPLLTPLDIEPFRFDLIITVGDVDRNCRPNLPGMPPHLHWDVPDPKPGTHEAEALTKLRKARDKLKKKVETLFDSELLHALFISRYNLELVLDNLSDGVMAHTTNRRIFFFNRAAEKVTGYRREDIIGKDCHDVFPGRFCGGDCNFCEGSKNHKKKGVIKKKLFLPDPTVRNVF